MLENLFKNTHETKFNNRSFSEDDFALLSSFLTRQKKVLAWKLPDADAIADFCKSSRDGVPVTNFENTKVLVATARDIFWQSNSQFSKIFRGQQQFLRVPFYRNSDFGRHKTSGFYPGKKNSPFKISNFCPWYFLTTR